LGISESTEELLKGYEVVVPPRLSRQAPKLRTLGGTTAMGEEGLEPAPTSIAKHRQTPAAPTFRRLTGTAPETSKHGWL
jgi:hypothetical protein